MGAGTRLLAAQGTMGSGGWRAGDCSPGGRAGRGCERPVTLAEGESGIVRAKREVIGAGVVLASYFVSLCGQTPSLGVVAQASAQGVRP